MTLSCLCHTKEDTEPQKVESLARGIHQLRGVEMGTTLDHLQTVWLKSGERREALPGARVLELRGMGGRSEVSPQGSGDRWDTIRLWPEPSV